MLCLIFSKYCESNIEFELPLNPNCISVFLILSGCIGSRYEETMYETDKLVYNVEHRISVLEVANMTLRPLTNEQTSQTMKHPEMDQANV